MENLNSSLFYKQLQLTNSNLIIKDIHNQFQIINENLKEEIINESHLNEIETNPTERQKGGNQNILKPSVNKSDLILDGSKYLVLKGDVEKETDEKSSNIKLPPEKKDENVSKSPNDQSSKEDKSQENKLKDKIPSDDSKKDSHPNDKQQQSDRPQTEEQKPPPKKQKHFEIIIQPQGRKIFCDENTCPWKHLHPKKKQIKRP